VCPSLSLACRSDISVRDQYILSYADYLHSDPALWRITVAYMCSCGSIGRERADQVLLRVPISFKTNSGNSGDVNAAARSGEVPAALKAVVETCHEYGRESVRRMVCTVSVPPATFIPCLKLSLCRLRHGISFNTRNMDWLFHTQPRQKTGLGSVE